MIGGKATACIVQKRLKRNDNQNTVSYSDRKIGKPSDLQLDACIINNEIVTLYGIHHPCSFIFFGRHSQRPGGDISLYTKGMLKFLGPQF